MRTARKYPDENPEYSTKFKILIDKDNIYLGIKCFDEKGDTVSIAGKEKDDAGLWNGDTVEFLIETDHRAYYQLAINRTLIYNNIA